MPAPCGVPLIRLTPLTAFQDTGLKPHPDKPEDASVGDPVREHPHQPLMVNRVEGRRHALPTSETYRVL